jgi:hypothetical protein
MLTPLLFAAALLAADPDFEVQSLDGSLITGRLVELDGDHLAVETADGPRAIELGSLASVARAGAIPANPPAKAPVVVELVDGSRFPLAEYAVAGDVAQMTLISRARIELPTRTVRSVRFARAEGSDDKRDRQWAEIADARAAGDVLVIRKQGALDEVEGTLQDVDGETVRFEVDKEVVGVNRAKVEGFFYYHPAATDVVEPIGFLTTVDGSRLAVLAAELERGSLIVKTVAGLERTLDVESVVRFDYSTGKIAYLSDLEPQSASYAPLVGPKEDLPALAEYYRYRRDQGFDQRPLSTGGKSYRKGLSLASRTALAYRLPGKFRVFKATVGIDDQVRPLGSVRLVVLGDGKALWQQEVRGDQPVQELEVEILGVKRLEIVADYGEELDIGDRLDLCEARVSK